MTSSLTPLRAVREATADEIRAILSWTHSLWGGRLDLAGYEAHTRASLETTWGRSHYRFFLGLDGENRPVTACKRYDLDVIVDGRPARAIGFGAVFTPAEARGRGYAATMLRALMGEARAAGFDWALLFSDIGPEYYRALGFEPLGTRCAEVAARPGASPFRPATPEETARLGDWLAQADSPRFAFRRDPDYMAYLLARKFPDVWAYAPEGLAQGLVAVRRSGGTLDLFALAPAPQTDPRGLYAALPALAAAEGASALAGWMPEAAAAAGLALRPVDDGVPMLAALGAQRPPQGVHVWDLDHF